MSLGGSVSATPRTVYQFIAIYRYTSRYWGQNSYGATHSDTANWQKTLSTYCQDDSIDAFPVAFLNVYFGAGGLPSMDLANICNMNDDAVFPGTTMPDCSFLASDIEFCQSKGKIVTLSLGGATGAAGFTSDQQASNFGDTIWNLYLGGSSSTRPFGTAVLDGIDLDIEGGSTQYYASFVNRIRTLAAGASKKYYVTAAPQCPFPDAYLSTVLNAVAFDAVYVQFYNNYCALSNYPNNFDFGDWDNWAKTVAISKDVKIYIGAAASSTAAGSGYADITTVINAALAIRDQYSSFGGIMLWDASQAYANNRADKQIKNGIRQSGNGGTTSNPVTVPTTGTTTSTTVKTTTTTTTPHTTTTTTSTPVTTTTTASSGNCAGVASWVANVAYNGGDQVVYAGHLWTAKWWSYGSTPGGAVGDWADDGACASFAAAVPTEHAAAITAQSKEPAPAASTTSSSLCLAGPSAAAAGPLKCRVVRSTEAEQLQSRWSFARFFG
ncbi:glycoside hydrolase [Epithele typhae]|uniref:glycoside hydrolase n=1 Tax=Epithele typhae TaxID=378194 RepID=UPI00200802C0|nr:glycoside hydrolase [Epithele typhae]KAH9944983.1 glycoside hydrolase [Epithele typhae]